MANDFNFLRDNPVDAIELMDCDILPGRFRNFSGDPEKAFGSNQRSCCVVIHDKEYAEELQKIGWKIGILAPREEDDEAKYFIQVKINFRDRYGSLKSPDYQPKIYLIASNGTSTRIEEDMVNALDQQVITSAKVRITGSRWERISTKQTGISAYLDSMVYTIREDEFLKHALENTGAKNRIEDDGDLPF